MAKKQPRSEFGIDLRLKDNEGHKAGRLVISSGGVDWYPRYARTPHASLSLKSVAEAMMFEQKIRNANEVNREGKYKFVKKMQAVRKRGRH